MRFCLLTVALLLFELQKCIEHNSCLSLFGFHVFLFPASNSFLDYRNYFGNLVTRGGDCIDNICQLSCAS
jgi:hypothetical protein